MENAKGWFDEARINWITDRFSKPDIKYFQNPVIVDNKTNEIITKTVN